MHVRQQLREAFVAVLDPIAGTTTYNGRVFPLYDSVLPAYSVFSREESISDENNEGRLIRQQHRSTILAVVGYAKVDADLDDNLDNLATWSESAIFNDLTIRNMVRCLDLISTEIDVDQTGEKSIGTITMNYQCRYITEDGEPEVII